VLVHVHSHDTAGIAVSSMLACAAAGADVVDCAIDSMSGMTSQPAMGAICAALEQTKLGTGINYDAIQALNLYWTQLRLLYSPFDANVKSSDSSVFQHEMPGGQYTNLMFQAQSLGLGSQWTAVKQAYIWANELCGDIIKVTPSSKVVGDFAQWMVSNKFTKKDVIERASSLDFPNSVRSTSMRTAGTHMPCAGRRLLPRRFGPTSRRLPRTPAHPHHSQQATDRRSPRCRTRAVRLWRRPQNARREVWPLYLVHRHPVLLHVPESLRRVQGLHREVRRPVCCADAILHWQAHCWRYVALLGRSPRADSFSQRR
jgi:hypothetical protein